MRHAIAFMPILPASLPERRLPHHERAPNPNTRPPIPATVRHELLGELAVLLLLAPTEAGDIKAADVDGELLHHCRAALAIDVEAVAGWPCANRRWRAMRDYTQAISAALALPARSPEGLRAKAVLALALGAGGHALAVSLARDVAGRLA